LLDPWLAFLADDGKAESTIAGYERGQRMEEAEVATS